MLTVLYCSMDDTCLIGMAACVLIHLCSAEDEHVPSLTWCSHPTMLLNNILCCDKCAHRVVLCWVIWVEVMVLIPPRGIIGYWYFGNFTYKSNFLHLTERSSPASDCSWGKRYCILSKYGRPCQIWFVVYVGTFSYRGLSFLRNMFHDAKMARDWFSQQIWVV